jgi:hypothetical protein
MWQLLQGTGMLVVTPSSSETAYSAQPAAFLHGLLFHHEDGGGLFLRNAELRFQNIRRFPSLAKFSRAEPYIILRSLRDILKLQRH